MLPKFRRFLVLPLLLLASLPATQVHAQAREEARLLVATEVLDQLREQRDQVIPERLLQRAYGIAVIPDVTKVAFVVGGRRGSGVMVVRDSKGRFTNPVFINLTGGSVGWQIGAQSTDIVLVFTSQRGIEGIADGKLTLGADAAVAAGPVGRAASAGTDQNFTAEVYSYSRNRGLFAGIALDGSILSIDSKSNKGLYGQTAAASDIIARRVSTDADAAKRFERAILASTAGHNPTPAAAASTSPGAPATVTTTGTPTEAGAPAASGLPIEDAQPGAEPPR